MNLKGEEPTLQVNRYSPYLYGIVGLVILSHAPLTTSKKTTFFYYFFILFFIYSSHLK